MHYFSEQTGSCSHAPPWNLYFNVNYFALKTKKKLVIANFETWFDLEKSRKLYVERNIVKKSFTAKRNVCNYIDKNALVTSKA